MKIGILGGTFDPPHIGHLAIARAAIEALDLDETLFLPAFRNPLKRGRSGTPAKHRLEMVRRLLEGEAKLAVCDIEITRGGPSYAVDTLAELQMAQPAEYWFLMGSDALKDLALWKQPERLVKLCRIGAIARGGKPVEETLARLSPELRARVDVVHAPPIDISASDLRNAIAQGRPVHLWIPEKVRKYIESNKLYKTS